PPMPSMSCWGWSATRRSWGRRRVLRSCAVHPGASTSTRLTPSLVWRRSGSSSSGRTASRGAAATIRPPLRCADRSLTLCGCSTVGCPQAVIASRCSARPLCWTSGWSASPSLEPTSGPVLPREQGLWDPAGLFATRGDASRVVASGWSMIFVRSPFPTWPQNGVVMSMQPRPWPDVPELTARMARSSSPKGNLAMRIREELGEVYADARFAAAFGARGRPGISPGQLMMASVLQFSANLTDRQAAEAVRDRITWKYALGLELEDPGFDASVLSEFRSRLVAGDLTSLALDALLERLAGLGLVRAGGRQRTDSTHVLGAIRDLNRLELAGETLRAGLEALAAAGPGWLAGVIDASWQQVYGARIDDLHLPESQARRKELMTRYGKDGYYLLEQAYGPAAPGWLRELPAIEALRRVWIQQFYREGTDGRQEVRRREKLPGGDGLPPARAQLISPYDLDARYGVKRDHGWAGYKVHFTETCDDPRQSPAPGNGRGDPPNVITAVATTEATADDTVMTTPIHEQLGSRGLLPGEHLADSGYPSAELIVHAARTFGITLVSPVRPDSSAQARAGAGYDKAAFSIDFD